jgi:predicted O-methyltransferase YrrM
MNTLTPLKAIRDLISLFIDVKEIRHFEPSIICSPSTEERAISNNFFELLLRAIQYAQTNKIIGVSENLKDSQFFNVFPGEHYRLIKGLVWATKATEVVEIGTYTGMGSIALSEGFDSRSGCIKTYDIIPYSKFNTHINVQKMFPVQFEQRIIDLSVEENFLREFNDLSRANIIFLDGPKDGRFEYILLDFLTRLQPTQSRLLVIDDIRFLNMTALWRRIKSEKIDCTSFGHWSGTGVVDISSGLKLAD